MKVSVSLPDDEVRYLDDQASLGRYPSRSAAVSSAIRAMRQRELTDSYVKAFDEWAATEDAALWDSTTSDGLGTNGWTDL